MPVEMDNGEEVFLFQLQNLLKLTKSPWSREMYLVALIQSTR